MNKPHKWANEIIAWANGKEIERYNSITDTWTVVSDPIWGGTQYRIKPEPKEDRVLYTRIEFCTSDEWDRETLWTSYKEEEDNIKAVFDGETGVLKSVEMIKCD